MVRITLNHILIGTLNAVQQRRRVNAKHMFLGTETPLAYAPHKYNAKNTLSTGTQTTLWYGSKKDMETNQVVWEAILGVGGISWVSSTLPTYNVQNVS